MASIIRYEGFKLKILFDLGHPAHVHLFRNAINILEGMGHKLKITARKKDIVLDLLDYYGFDYEVVGNNKKGLLKKAIYMLVVDYNLLNVSRRFKPDIFVSAGSPYAAHVSKLLKKPSITFIDTEHANLTANITEPFTNIICTPMCYKKQHGKKHVRYDGYHDLAYLHPLYFVPDKGVLRELGLRIGDKYSIIRFISWNASHDVKQSGMNNKMKYISILEQYGRVFVSSEENLGDEFEKYKLKISPEKFHSLLFYAQLYLGEGGSAATEAAILGTPSILINTTAKFCGVFDDLEKYNLIHTFDDEHKALDKAKEILSNPKSKELWVDRKDIMLKEMIDVNTFMIELIEECSNTDT